MTPKSKTGPLSRIVALRGALHRARLDALLLTHAPNIRYLSGFSGTTGVLGVTRTTTALFTDSRYAVQAKKQVKGATLHIGGTPLRSACDWIQRSSAKKIGVEGAHLPAKDLLSVQKWTGRGRHVKVTQGVVEEQRQVKNGVEIAKIRKAAALGSELFGVALKQIGRGRREVEIAAALEYAARMAGAEGMSFATIVAGGVRSAMPHGVASRARLPRRGFVVLDFGVILTGYCSDMTRTVHIGKPDAAARDVYAAVLEAQAAAIRAVKGGVEAGEVDRAARAALRRRGLEKYFTHSTGHGVGLEIHEPPRLAKGSKEVLRAGMVITIEPGIYIQGKGGIRIEDMVLVTRKGCEVLTSARKELVVI